MAAAEYDVAVAGGGPAGFTLSMSPPTRRRHPPRVLRVDDPLAAEVYEFPPSSLRPDPRVEARGDLLREDVMGIAPAATGRRGRFPVAPVSSTQPGVSR